MIASRESVSTLILRTPCRMPSWISSTGTPQRLLHLAAVLVDDLDQLARHRRGAVHHQVRLGQALVDLLDQVHRQHLAVGLAVELVGAVAGADRDGERVDAGRGRRTRPPGRGRSGAPAPEPTPSSMPPSVPSSPSTVTPLAWAASTTSRVTATLYSNDDGVLPSSSSEPSIITLVKPRSMADLQVSGLLPWSRCSADRDLRIELGRGQHQVPEEAVVACTSARPARPG